MPQDNALVFFVPAGHFFAIADNRENANSLVGPAFILRVRPTRPAGE
jgi:hypothetical protein